MRRAHACDRLSLVHRKLRTPFRLEPRWRRFRGQSQVKGFLLSGLAAILQAALSPPARRLPLQRLHSAGESRSRLLPRFSLPAFNTPPDCSRPIRRNSRGNNEAFGWESWLTIDEAQILRSESSPIQAASETAPVILCLALGREPRPPAMLLPSAKEAAAKPAPHGPPRSGFPGGL